jgi:hypothetical protein
VSEAEGAEHPVACELATVAGIGSTGPDLKRIGLTLEALGGLRNAADYQLSVPGSFVSARIAVQPRPTPRQPSPCSMPSKPNPCDRRRPLGQSPHERSEHAL